MRPCSSFWKPAAVRFWTAIPGCWMRSSPQKCCIKTEVVSADEREGDLRRILNFGHTIGHTLEAETKYMRFLHGEAVAFGMNAATHLAVSTGALTPAIADRIIRLVNSYGPIPPTSGIRPESPGGSPGKRQEDDAGQGSFRSAGGHRRREDRLRDSAGDGSGGHRRDSPGFGVDGHHAPGHAQ